MKTFFLFIDDEQQGPFSLEELKTKTACSTSKVLNTSFFIKNIIINTYLTLSSLKLNSLQMYNF